MKKLAALLAAAALILTACSEQLTDLENVPVQDPDTVIVYRNVDQFPNILVMCLNGDALIMRSNNYDDMMILHIPDNDNNLCQ